MLYTDFKNIKLSKLGFGNMRLPVIGDDPNGDIDYPKAKKIIDHAMKVGINYYDTAYIYHNNGSEGFLGRAMKDYPRDAYYLATKFFIDIDPDYEKVFNTQLERLDTDHIDFYLLHGLSDDNVDKYLKSGCIDYFENLQKIGKTTYFGFSSHASPETLKRMADFRPWDFVQIQMNYLDWIYANTKAEYEILAEKGFPLIIMEPVRGGVLSDMKKDISDPLKKEMPQWTVASWALRWLKGRKNIKVILSGMSSIEQVDDNVSTLCDEEPLSEKQKELLVATAKKLKESITVSCTGCKYCCAPCPKELDIPKLIKAYNIYKYVGWWTGSEFNDIDKDKRPSACISCGACEELCPQGIHIPKILEELNTQEKKAAEENKHTS